MSDRHPHAEVIHAWAEGKTVQCWKENCGKWEDVVTSYPHFHNLLFFRIKPKTKKIRFRNYLVSTKHYGPRVQTHMEPWSSPEKSVPAFIKWLGDWQEVEVEDSDNA